MIRESKLTMWASASLLLAACSSDDPPVAPVSDAPADPVMTIDWTTCPDQAVLECGTLSVLMDYSNELLGSIQLALHRLPAFQQPAEGVLFINTGGPGASLDVTEGLAELNILPESVQQRYDLINFDPRGFGQSTPLDCDAPENLAPSYFLSDAERINTFVQQSTEAAASWHAKVGDYLLQLICCHP